VSEESGIRPVAKRVRGPVVRMPTTNLLLRDEVLEGQDFKDIRVDNLVVVSCTLTRCDFSNARVKREFTPGEARGRSTFIECSFDGAKMRLGNIGYGRFERCSFRNVVLSNWFWDNVDLVECVFSGVIRDGNIYGMVNNAVVADMRLENEIVGNDFAGASLQGIGFLKGVDLTRQVLPKSRDYIYVPDLRATLDAVRRDVTTWDDLKLRKEMLVFVSLEEHSLRGGQEQELFHAKTFPRNSFGDRFAELLLQHGGQFTDT
jgi:uncharacterized protein YjbI with pentapeptide repeats